MFVHLPEQVNVSKTIDTQVNYDGANYLFDVSVFEIS